ncbi:MAG: PilZ domain-containing protein [Thermodesulfobacteriota bacterium]
MIEQRRLKRRQLVYYLKVNDRLSGQTVGRLVDITTEGVMLISSYPIETNRVYQMVMTLPQEMEGAREIAFDAKSHWCRKDVNPDFYVAGFQFVTVSPEDVLTITDLIRQYELPGGAA